VGLPLPLVPSCFSSLGVAPSAATPDSRIVPHFRSVTTSAARPRVFLSPFRTRVARQVSSSLSLCPSSCFFFHGGTEHSRRASTSIASVAVTATSFSRPVSVGALIKVIMMDVDASPPLKMQDTRVLPRRALISAFNDLQLGRFCTRHHTRMTIIRRARLLRRIIIRT